MKVHLKELPDISKQQLYENQAKINKTILQKQEEKYFFVFKLYFFLKMDST
jgi:hypothetical protein